MTKKLLKSATKRWEGGGTMTNIHQLTCQVRFHLEQLAVRNAHHEFEHLCRHLARARICSNILPATGPVAAGGDQGRDFETFVTHIKDNRHSDTSIFRGLASDEPLAFACTTQKDGIKGKIQSDVQKIMREGTVVAGVHYFCTTDISVAVRHDLQAWVNEAYNINMEIYDGQAISELITDREIFWIAEQFLGISAMLFPPPPEQQEDTWYHRLLVYWNENWEREKNYADFTELKAAIRFATFENNYKKDIPFWVKSLRTFLNDRIGDGLRRKALYEIAVATLRGMGYLNGMENDIREYFSSIAHLETASEIEDAEVLWKYCAGARNHNVVELSEEELIQWKEQIKTKIEDVLNSVGTPGIKCYLLEIKGHHCLADMIFADINTDNIPRTYIKQAVGIWRNLLENIQEAPLFPLERFADRLAELIKLFGYIPELEEMCREIDELLGERFGEFTAAEKCKDRALNYYERGEILRAINELHSAKVKWFAQETINASLRAILIISNWYLRLGLGYAAKYYALAAAYIAVKHNDIKYRKYVPSSLLTAASCDYYQGNWIGFLDLAEIAIPCHNAYSKEPWDILSHEEWKYFYFETSVILTLAERLDKNLFNLCYERICKLGLDGIDELTEQTKSNWMHTDLTHIWQHLTDQIDRPFSDTGGERISRWKALGIRWNFIWKNDYSTTAISEQFIAALQIFLADLVDKELCLLSTDVDIYLRPIGQSEKAKAVPKPSNAGRVWEIFIPIKDSVGRDLAREVEIEVINLAFVILRELSLLPQEQFSHVVKSSISRGLTSKLLVAQPYETLFKEFYFSETFVNSKREEIFTPRVEYEFAVREHPELKSNDAVGPTYNFEQTKELLHRRYTNAMKGIQFTLKRLLKNEEFLKTVRQLRSEGWLDWHILGAVASITVNTRINADPRARMDKSYCNKLFAHFFSVPEDRKWAAVPPTFYSINEMQQIIRMNMVSSLHLLELECHQETPDLDGIEQFLVMRYRYKVDDIEHRDPFPGV